MTVSLAPASRSLRVFCLEDNPLIVFHIEQILEDLGHAFGGASDSFAELKARWNEFASDCVLVDIDLADGRTGPDAAAWLAQRGVPALFVTGQDTIAAVHENVVVAVVSKPIIPAALASALTLVAQKL